MPCLYLPLLLVGAQLSSSFKVNDWSYRPNTNATAKCGSPPAKEPCGPANWYTVNPDCNVPNTQSPINAPFKTATKSETIKVTDLVLTADPSKPCLKSEFVMNAHTSQVVTGRSCPGSFVATFMGKVFNLLQFNYHSPSENTVDGAYFPMEVHHVFQALDGQVLVLAVFVTADEMLETGRCTGRSANMDTCIRANFFREIQSLMPTVNTSKMDVHGNYKVEQEVDVNPFTQFIPPMTSHFFYFNGSFTTPACDTNVVWILNPTPVTIYDSSLTLFRNLINTYPAPGNQLTVNPALAVGFAGQPFFWNAALGTNNRPLQQLGTRGFYQVGDAPVDSSASSSGPGSTDSLGSSMSSTGSSASEPSSDSSASRFSPSGITSMTLFGSSGSYFPFWLWPIVACCGCLILVSLGAVCAISSHKNPNKRRTKKRDTTLVAAVEEAAPLIDDTPVIKLAPRTASRIASYPTAMPAPNATVRTVSYVSSPIAYAPGPTNYARLGRGQVV